MAYSYKTRTKAKAEARAAGLKRYFTGQPCSSGHIAERLVSSGACLVCAEERNAKYRAEHREKARERTREWQKTNAGKVNATTRARHVDKLQRRLPGYDDILTAIYEEAQAGEHVDHVVPLKHPLVCGLHVPWNLQFLPEKENLKKKNSFDPASYQGELARV